MDSELGRKGERHPFSPYLVPVGCPSYNSRRNYTGSGGQCEAGPVLEGMSLGANASVALEPRGEAFVASIPLAQLERLGNRPDEQLQVACDAYGRTVGIMREVLADIEQLKSSRTPIPARKMWELGDAVVNLGAELEENDMEMDGLNDHLVRDLGINAKRMGTIVTFRRHLPDQEMIPETLGWSQCEKKARHVAQELRSQWAAATES